ncbi:TetR/AcrR family transcriptional regulator [Myxococcota bacterium]|nr:TetR/AcrR family transcriptional regulator [Myxococcota bacterium]
MPDKPYHHGDLRRALLDAAMALIEENGGPHGWSLREAARRAGVSPGAPYRHFEDKQALLVALGLEGLERLNALCAEEAAAREPDPLSQFRAMGIATVRFAAHNPVHYRVMNLPEVLMALQPHLQPTQDRVDQMVGEAVAQPGVRLDDAALLSLAGQAMVYGIARMFVDGHFAAMGVGPDQAEPLASRLTEILGTGFFATPPKDA